MLNFKFIESSNIIFNIPKSHHNSHLYNFSDKYSSSRGFYEKVQHLVTDLFSDKHIPTFTFLCGTAGSGKSHLMIGIYRALVQKLGYVLGESGVCYIPFMNLAQDIIAGFKENIPLRPALSSYTVSKWLLIDDFTASERVFKVDSLEFNILRDIFIDRYERNRFGIFSSNLTKIELLPEMERLFGGYVLSRLKDSNIIQFPEIDLRNIKK